MDAWGRGAVFRRFTLFLIMCPIRLSSFNNEWYLPGRSSFWQATWFLVGSPLLRSAVIPFSGFRTRLLRLFGAEIGKGVVIKPGVRVKYPWRLRIGSYSWLGEDSWIDNLANVEIGSNVCLSQDTYLCTGNHDWTDPSFGLIVKPICVEDGAWIGARSIVCPGVHVGQAAVVSAGSVVNRNVPPDEIHSGNPAAFVRRRKVQETRSGQKDTAQVYEVETDNLARVRQI